MSDALLKQADHMWKMLDNMAENNPEGYQRFIKKQLHEGSAHFKPPEPVFCLSCEIDKGILTNAVLFINVCQWCQVPKPKTDNDPIPVKGGTLRKLGPTAQVYDVAFNPTIIEECATQEDANEQLIQLILDYTTNMTKLTLKRKTCKKADKKFVGSMQDIISSIDERHQSSMHYNCQAKSDQPQSLLDQLANINQETDQEADIVLPGESVVTNTASSKKLIEEIPAGDNHALRYYMDNSDRDMFTISIQVGNDGKSIAEAELDVSENELELKVPGVPDRLIVKLPRTVDKDRVAAKYQPKTGQLCVTMNYKQN